MSTRKGVFTLSANEEQHGGDHYKKLKVQCWDYITANNIGYLEGNVIKYVSRWRDKGGIEDLKKAQHYLAKLVEIHEPDQRTVQGVRFVHTQD